MALSMISSIGDLYLASMNSGWKNISGPRNLSYPTSHVYFYNYLIILFTSLVSGLTPSYFLNLLDYWNDPGPTSFFLSYNKNSARILPSGTT